VLAQKGSLLLTRPVLMDYIRAYSDFVFGCQELFEPVMAGKLKIHIGQSYYLSDAASAHRDLEARKTWGGTILVTA
jgi:NADPH2:quinone reductase